DANDSMSARSPPSRGRGSKHGFPRNEWHHPGGRPPHGGVDRNIMSAEEEVKRLKVAPLTGAWIETRSAEGIATGWRVAPLTGAWIETSSTSSAWRMPTVAPLTGAWIETSWRTTRSTVSGG